MPEKHEVHIADVRVLKRGYVAACETCEWVGHEHADPAEAVQDAARHEEYPGPEPKPIRLKKIRRRL